MHQRLSHALLGLLAFPVALIGQQQRVPNITMTPVVVPNVFKLPVVPDSVFLKPDPAKGTVWFDEGPRTWTVRTTEPAITANDLRTHLYQLADDSMMGRAVATLGGYKATAYIESQFRKMGLEPGGENGSFFQVLPYGPTGFDSTTLSLSVDGQALAWKRDWAPLASGAAYGPKFDGRSVPTVFGGRWGDTTTALDLDAIRGKVVVFLPAAAPAGGPGRGGAAGAPGGRGGVGGRGGAGANDLRPRDAEAALVLLANLNPEQPPVLPSSAGRNALRSSVPGAGASITPAVVERIFGKPIAELRAGDMGKPVSGFFDYAVTLPQYPARNVIGIRRGSDPVLRDEYVVIAAHNDHVGMVPRAPLLGFPDHDSVRAFRRVMQPQGANDRVALDAVTPEEWARINALIAGARKIRPPRPDSVNNGADDDGSGTVVLMEIAEAFAKGVAPKRSIIFLSQTGEESGMLGSSTWTDWPTVPREKIVAAFNMDMLGKGRATDVNLGGPNSVQILGSRRLSTAFGDVIDSVNATHSEPMAIDYTWEMTRRLNRFCRSDQVSFFRYDIPVAYLSLGYAIDYHSPTDEPQYIDYDHGARVGRFVHALAKAVADRNDRFVNDGPVQNRFQGCSGG